MSYERRLRRDQNLHATVMLVGRVLLSFIFLGSGMGKIDDYAGTAEVMAVKELPLVDVLLAGTILIEIGASLMIITGLYARLGALLLALWLVPVTLVFHAFWTVSPEQQELEMIMFMKNMAIMGGLLLLLANGSGRFSIRL